MLSGSAMLRVAVLFVTAGLLAGLVQYYWPQAAQEPATRSADPPIPAEPQPAPKAARDPVRTIPTTKAPPASAAQPAPPVTPEPATGASPGPSPSPSPNAPADSVRADLPAAPPAARMPSEVGPSPDGTDAAERAQDDAGPRALALVDLNTATLAQLNGLKGGGNIGRAIIQRRPYSSVDQLLSKRVLSRATYDKIKDQVTVQ